MWQARAAPRVEVPRPVQLGSLKSENEGQDPGIRLVPAGGGGWGRKKEDVIEEEEVVETQQQNPRLGNLTSQPAQLRPTAWGRSSLSAQAGPRPAPWAQPPPGKVVPEPVPLERRQQEDFPSLGAEPVKGRKSSGSTPSTSGPSVASSRPIGAAPTRSSYLQDRPVAAERREALERREREEALRAAAVLAPPKREEPVPVVKEFREEPRREERKAMERQNSDPDEADKDKELMKNLADKRRAEKKEEEEERARQQFDRAQEKLRLLEKRARERERMEEEERQEQLRALREGPRVAEAPPTTEAEPAPAPVREAEALETVQPGSRLREAPRMEIHEAPMPEAPAPRVEMNMPMPEAPEADGGARNSHDAREEYGSASNGSRRFPPPPMQQPPPPSVPSLPSRPKATPPQSAVGVSVWGDALNAPAPSPAIGGHFPDLGGVPAQSKKEKQKAAYANLSETKTSEPSTWGQAQRAPPTFTLQELAKVAVKKGRSAKVFGNKVDAEEIPGAFSHPAPVAPVAPMQPVPAPAAPIGGVPERQPVERQPVERERRPVERPERSAPRHEGLWEDHSRPQGGQRSERRRGREGQDGPDRRRRGEGREERIRLEKRDDGSRREREEREAAEASPSHEDEEVQKTFKIDPQKPVRILQKPPEEKAKEKVQQPLAREHEAKAEVEKGKGKSGGKGGKQKGKVKGRGRGPRQFGEDSDADWSEASGSEEEEKAEKGKGQANVVVVSSEDESEPLAAPKGKAKGKGKKGKDKGKGAGKKGWVRVEREDEAENEEEEREEIEARLRNSKKVLESRAQARAEAERQRQLLRKRATEATVAAVNPESFETPESSDHEVEKQAEVEKEEQVEDFHEVASLEGENDESHDLRSVTGTPTAQMPEEPTPELETLEKLETSEHEEEPAVAEGHDEAEAVEMDADETYEAEAEGDAIRSQASEKEEVEQVDEDDEEEPPVPKGSMISQEAMGRLNPVADTGLALGIGMVAVQGEEQEVDSDDLLDFETVKNKTERKADKQTQRRVKEEHATRAAIRKEAQRQRERAKELERSEAAAASAAASERPVETSTAAMVAGPKHEVIKLSDLRRNQREECLDEAPIYEGVQTNVLYEVQARPHYEEPHPSGPPPPYKPPDVRHLVVSMLKANAKPLRKSPGTGTRSRNDMGYEGKSYGDQDGWETWSPDDWMEPAWQAPMEDAKEERRWQADATEWRQKKSKPSASGKGGKAVKGDGYGKGKSHKGKGKAKGARWWHE